MDVPQSVVEGAQRQDPEAFDELIRLTNRDLFTLAYRITGNQEDAADVVQETYLKLLKVIKQFRGEAKFSTWLYRVASNVAITHLRKRKRDVAASLEDEQWDALPAPASSDPAAAAEQASLKLRLDEELAALPDGYRAVVVLRDVYGLSLAEVGAVVGISEGAAKVRLFRARQRLKVRLLDWRASNTEAEGSERKDEV